MFFSPPFSLEMHDGVITDLCAKEIEWFIAGTGHPPDAPTLHFHNNF